jgi:hypothetical protein
MNAHDEKNASCTLNSILVLKGHDKTQTPLPFQLRSTRYSPLYPEGEPCSEADTKTVRSLDKTVYIYFSAHDA